MLPAPSTSWSPIQIRRPAPSAVDSSTWTQLARGTAPAPAARAAEARAPRLAFGLGQQRSFEDICDGAPVRVRTIEVELRAPHWRRIGYRPKARATYEQVPRPKIPRFTETDRPTSGHRDRCRRQSPLRMPIQNP